MSSAPPPDASLSMVAAPATGTTEGLPLPRLILRLGGLGNRRFGTENENGIAETPEALKSAATEACRAVFAVIQETLEGILVADRAPANLYPFLDSRDCPWWKTSFAGLILGKSDRWDRKMLGGSHAGIFSADLPLVQILTGGEPGGDTIILKAAGDALSSVPFEHHLIVPRDPAEVTEGGLGIGTIPEPWEGSSELLPRHEAVQRGKVMADRAFGFRARSEALRHHSDILLAIWDPDVEREPGGTVESVIAALQEGIPVIAIRVRGPGRAEVEILRSRDDLRKHDPASPRRKPVPWQTRLGNVLTRILQFPDAPPVPEESDAELEEGEPQHKGAEHSRDHHSHPMSTAYHPRIAFAAFREDRPLMAIWPGRLWQGFNHLAKERAGIPTGKGEPFGFMLVFWGIMGLSLPVSPMPFPEEEGEQGTFLRHYDRAKKRADDQGMSHVYGDAYRGGIIASYLLATMAVFMAAFSVVLAYVQAHYQLTHPAIGITLAALALVEVLVILVMFFLATASQVEDWHEAYTDSRILAEALRMMECLGPMGVHTPMPRLPHYLRQGEGTPTPEAMWPIWYFRALVRMAPLRLHAQPTGLAADRERLLEWVDGQIDHHSNNAKKQEKLHDFIHRASTVLFVVVLFCAMAHLIDAVIFHSHHWTLFALTVLVCMGGPALIAALHGFTSQLEVQRLRQRSSSMESILRERKRVLASMKVNSSEAPVVWGLTVEALATASLMMDETASWSMLYRNTDIHAG